VFQTGRFSLAVSSIVAGGVALGAALAMFARPVPIEPQPAPWEGMLHPAIAVGESHGYYDSLPEEVYPGGGYAPTSGFSPLRWWPADLRLPRDLTYVPPPEPVQVAVPQYAPDSSLDSYQEVQVPHYAAIEQSAQQAQQAAQEAATAEQAQPDAPTADAGEAKTIHVADQLAQAG
jgi:hypothetical protein